MLLEADLPDDPDTLRAIVVEAWNEVASRDAALVLRDAQIADLSIATQRS